MPEFSGLPPDGQSPDNRTEIMPIWARDLPLLLTEVYTKLKAKEPRDPESRLIDLVEWMGRIPTKYPRQVHISDELARQRILTPYEIEGIRRLTVAIERGDSLTMFLGDTTRSIRNRRDEKPNRTSRNDLFFSDWGLLHFHLGADLNGSGKRVMRSRRVLIARITQDDAYLIDVEAHGKGFFATWGHKRFLEILYRNWPHTLENYCLKGMTSTPEGNTPSAEDYVRIRQGGVVVPIQIDGKMFIGPGLGISSDRSSTLAVQRADLIREELKAGEQFFRTHRPQGDALLFVGKDAAVGYFIPDEDLALCVFPQRHKESRVTQFFSRLLDESEILHNVADGAIWTASTPPPSA